MTEPQETWIVVVVILQTGAKGRRYRQELAYVHGVVVIVIAPVSEVSSVGPIVLNHIYPQRKDSSSNPHHNSKLQISCQLPQEIKTKGLCKEGKKWVFYHPKGPRLQNPVVGQILSALIRHEAEISGSPKTVA